MRHPNATLGAVAGFILAVLRTYVGLSDTLVIAFFVLIGAVIGQIRDGENGIVNFFGRLFSGRSYVFDCRIRGRHGGPVAFNTKVDVADTELEADRPSPPMRRM